MSPHMSKDNQDKKEQFFEFIKAFFNEGTTTKPAPLPGKPKSHLLTGKALEKLVNKCAGAPREKKKCVLLHVATKARKESYAEIKKILIGLFGFNPSEFGGLHLNKQDGTFSFLAEEDAYKRYAEEPPNTRAGTVLAWTAEEATNNVPTIALICNKVAENSSNKSLKAAAKELSGLINRENSMNISEFISQYGDRSLNVPDLKL